MRIDNVYSQYSLGESMALPEASSSWRRLQVLLLLASLSFLGVSADAQSCLEGETPVAVGQYPYALNLVDLNADGLNDLAIASMSGVGMKVMLGLADGSFGPPAQYTTGIDPIAIAHADFNGDGSIDLVIANYGSATVSLFLNIGNGSFGPRIDLSVGMNPSSIIATDLDANGTPDIATTNAGSDTVSVLLNQGLGQSFQRTDFGTAHLPFALAALDADGDGDADIAVANFEQVGTVTVYTNQGAGAFSMGQQSAVGVEPAAIASLDVNQDGNMDLIVANYSGGMSGSISVLLGQGAGTFLPQVQYNVGLGPWAIAGADFDGDGNLDLATTDFDSHEVSLLHGIGGGLFAAGKRYIVGRNPSSIQAGQIDRNGSIDLVVSNFSSSSVSVLVNLGNGGFRTEPRYDVGGSPISVAVLDYDLNGTADLAATSLGSDTVDLLSNAGDGSLMLHSQIHYPFQSLPGCVATGDFNADGLSDIAVVTTNPIAGGFWVWVQLNMGGSAFSAPTGFPVVSYPGVVRVADLNGDGKLDLAVLNQPGVTGNSSISVLMSQGAGVFAPQVEYVTPQASDIACADVDGDGDIDIVEGVIGITTFVTGMAVLPNQGNGTFAAPVVYGIPMDDYTSGVCSGDLNNDGRPDAVVLDTTRRKALVFMNSGGGVFAPAVEYDVGRDPSGVTIADLSGDSQRDIVVANGGDNSITVLTNQGAGIYGTGDQFFTGGNPACVIAHDLDLDGDADVVVVNRASDSVSILRNCRNSGVSFCEGDGAIIACPCGNNSPPGGGAGCMNSLGLSGQLQASGSARISSDSVSLEAFGLTGSAAVFFQASNILSPVVIDDGIGCVGGVVVRLGNKPIVAHTSEFPQSADSSVSVRGSLPSVGGTRYYQCFYRNAATAFCPPATSNRTNGVAITWMP